MNCPDAGEKGRENYALAVASGVCAWCGWEILDHDFVAINPKELLKDDWEVVE